MITGAIKNQIDQIWNAFWSGGISNPLEVIEQITYLLFLRRLDDLHTLEENKSTRLKKPMGRRAFPKGDVYEYMLGKIATAGQNGQFRTPRHIIRLMVELTAPQPTDVICDPACGTAGFLVAAGEYLRERHPNILHDAKLREHFHHRMFHGFDFDNTMLRIGSMNTLLHGVENPDIR